MQAVRWYYSASWVTLRDLLKDFNNVTNREGNFLPWAYLPSAAKHRVKSHVERFSL